MKEIDKYDKLSKRVDNLDKEYSSTLSELLTDVHYIKCKVNKTDQLEYEQKQNDIEVLKNEKLNQNFIFKFVSILGSCLFGLVILLLVIKWLFF